MIKIQHKKSSVNIVLHMDHSQVHNSIGSVAKAALPTEIIMVGQHLRMMITTTGHLVDHVTHNTIRATSRSLIEVMATPEDTISQRVKSEPEPKWMQFGISSRTEFVELGGKHEIERMREGTYV